MELMPYHAVIFLEKSEKIDCTDGVVHLLLCSMAIEAFVQDMKLYYSTINANKPSFSTSGEFLKKTHEPKANRGGAVFNGKPPIAFINDEELHLLALLSSIEKESPNRKYEDLYNYLRLYNWSKSEDEDFKDLHRMIKLRNLLVHIKSDSRKLSDSGIIENIPNVINELLVKKVLDNNVSTFSSWVEILDQEKFITWSRKTAIKNMKKILEYLPKGKVTKNFKRQYWNTLNTFKL